MELSKHFKFLLHMVALLIVLALDGRAIVKADLAKLPTTAIPARPIQFPMTATGLALAKGGVACNPQQETCNGGCCATGLTCMGNGLGCCIKGATCNPATATETCLHASAPNCSPFVRAWASSVCCPASLPVCTSFAGYGHGCFPAAQTVEARAASPIRRLEPFLGAEGGAPLDTTTTITQTVLPTTTITQHLYPLLAEQQSSSLAPVTPGPVITSVVTLEITVVITPKTTITVSPTSGDHSDNTVATLNTTSSSGSRFTPYTTHITIPATHSANGTSSLPVETAQSSGPEATSVIYCYNIDLNTRMRCAAGDAAATRTTENRATSRNDWEQMMAAIMLLIAVELGRGW